MYSKYLGISLSRLHEMKDITGDYPELDFDYIGIREAKASINLTALVTADHLSEDDILEKIRLFYDCILGFKKSLLFNKIYKPNGVICFIFENENCTYRLRKFIPSQSLIDHTQRKGRVVVPWLINVKEKEIIPHNKMVGYLPPTCILHNPPLGVHPGLDAIEQLLNTYPDTQQFSTNSTLPVQTMKKIYISYAHAGEGKQVTESLDQAFQARNVRIVRDVRDVAYKESFREFMAELGAGDYVITVIDKPYLESKNCMGELVTVYENEEFWKRIFPVVLKDAGIYDTIQRLGYIKYWEDKTKELEEAMRGVGLANLQGIREELDLYTKIRQTFAAMVDILGDMNAMQLTSHQEEDFKTVFEAIHGEISKNGDTSPPLDSQPTALEGKALVQHHIAQGDTTAAIQEFLKIATANNEQGLYNDLILLSGRNTGNEKDYEGGTLSRDNYSIAKAKISKALNSYLEML